MRSSLEARGCPGWISGMGSIPSPWSALKVRGGPRAAAASTWEWHGSDSWFPLAFPEQRTVWDAVAASVRQQLFLRQVPRVHPCPSHPPHGCGAWAAVASRHSRKQENHPKRWIKRDKEGARVVLPSIGMSQELRNFPVRKDNRGLSISFPKPFPPSHPNPRPHPWMEPAPALPSEHPSSFGPSLLLQGIRIPTLGSFDVVSTRIQVGKRTVSIRKPVFRVAWNLGLVHNLMDSKDLCGEMLDPSLG